MYKKFLLNKKVRLLTLNEFSFVFQKPKKIKLSGISLFSRSNNLTYSRIGLAISKKYIKCSHERNRIKRYARETFRLTQNNLLKKDFVVTVFSNKIIHIKNHILMTIFEQLWRHHTLN